MYSKAFQERTEMNGSVPQKIRIEEEQMMLFQSFSGTERNEWFCSKHFQIEEEQI